MRFSPCLSLFGSRKQVGCSATYEEWDKKFPGLFIQSGAACFRDPNSKRPESLSHFEERAIASEENATPLMQCSSKPGRLRRGAAKAPHENTQHYYVYEKPQPYLSLGIVLRPPLGCSEVCERSLESTNKPLSNAAVSQYESMFTTWRKGHVERIGMKTRDAGRGKYFA